MLANEFHVFAAELYPDRPCKLAFVEFGSLDLEVSSDEVPVATGIAA